MVRFSLILFWSLLVLADPARAYLVGASTGSLFDAGRARTLPYTLYYPLDFEGPTRVLLFSHGGPGSPTAHSSYSHFGTHWAAAGYIGIHVGHLESSVPGTHRLDRPEDVSFVIDALESGDLLMPSDFSGELLLDRFGHAGHSFGAYTAMALAGGDYVLAPDFRDPRIVAIAAISPQGAGQFGAYDGGGLTHTWAEIEIPALNVVGFDEKDTNALGTIFEIDWRLTPFERYPATGDKFQVVLPDQDHQDVGAFPTETIAQYLGENTRRFFDVYVNADPSGVCSIGLSPPFPGQTLEGLPDLEAAIAAPCPPPIGVPEPDLSPAIAASLCLLGCLAGPKPDRGRRPPTCS